MTNKTTIALKMYSEMTDAERIEFLKEVNEFDRKSDYEKLRKKEQFNEQVRRATGPSAGSSRCQICGR